MININNKDWINKGLEKINFKKFTEIQEKTIPLLLKNNNLVGASPTGTGKTYCFLLPILDKVNFDLNEIQAVVIAPTRELCRQIFSKFNDFKEFNKELKVQLFIGGMEFDRVKEKFDKTKPQIIIATPEMFIELYNTNIKTNSINTIVFDEADMLVDLGFINIFKNIFDILSQNKNLQKIAFSATLHDMLLNKFSIYFKDTKIIDVSNNIWKNKNIKHILIHSHFNYDKNLLLKILLENINPYFCIIFCNTTKSASEVYNYLISINKNATLLHGKLESRKRKNTYKYIQNFQYQYLVATDLVSRGLDIDGASHIISWEMPKDDIWYVHRSGRTGRGKYNGESYVFFDNKNLLNINRLKEKGINWENIKIINNELINFDYSFKKRKIKKDTEVDKKIKYIINTSSKKVKPCHRKKIKNKIKKVKQKEKRKQIEKSVKEVLVKNYKIENAKKTQIRNSEKIKREKAEKRKEKSRR